MNTYQDYLFYFSCTFHFLLIFLKKSDLKLSDDRKGLTINIQLSKTDQFGRGSLTYIYQNNSIWCPINCLSILDKFENDDDNILIYSIQTLRYHLHIFKKNCVTDSENYSWYSFRRGGAYICGLNQVPDSIIKAHSRWKSSAYIVYVSVDVSHAGETISQIFNKL